MQTSNCRERVRSLLIDNAEDTGSIDDADVFTTYRAEVLITEITNLWTEGVSDTQRYKCLGNAVTVNVIQHIMQKLLPEYPREV